MPLATRLYKKRLVADCSIGIGELGHDEADARAPSLPDPPHPMPEVRTGASEVIVQTRCPDFGKVELEVWAGEPGPAPPNWRVLFDGPLTSNGTGFDVGDLNSFFHLNTAPGVYRVRAEARRGSQDHVDAVRFVFPESPDLTGHAPL
jgi:hypothetical protein